MYDDVRIYQRDSGKDNDLVRLAQLLAMPRAQLMEPARSRVPRLRAAFGPPGRSVGSTVA